MKKNVQNQKLLFKYSLFEFSPKSCSVNSSFGSETLSTCALTASLFRIFLSIDKDFERMLYSFTIDNFSFISFSPYSLYLFARTFPPTCVLLKF